MNATQLQFDAPRSLWIGGPLGAGVGGTADVDNRKGDRTLRVNGWRHGERRAEGDQSIEMVKMQLHRIVRERRDPETDEHSTCPRTYKRLRETTEVGRVPLNSLGTGLHLAVLHLRQLK